MPGRVGPYEIEKLIGQGGGGTVFRARTATPTSAGASGGVLALKLVPITEPEARIRAAREVEHLRAIRHEGLVPLLDAGECEFEGAAHVFLAMALVEGETLAQLTEGGSSIPEPMCRVIIDQVCGVLAALHTGGVIHRDLKPSNLVLTPDGNITILDLGIARSTKPADRVTLTGDFVGTPRYAAPEQIHGARELGPQADFFALGATIYELLLGAPFRMGGVEARDHSGRVILRTRRAASSATTQESGAARPDVSPFMHSVLDWMLNASPERRPADAKQLAEVVRMGERSAWYLEGRDRLAPRVPVICPSAGAPVVGRDALVQELDRLVAEAISGRGASRLIVGPAGSGKSRLMQFAADAGGSRSEAGGLRTVLFAFEGGGDLDVILDGLRSALSRINDLELWMREALADVPALVDPIAAALRGEDTEAAVRLDASRLHSACVRLLDACSTEQPLLLAFDDLHDAGELGFELFHRCAGRAHGSPRLVLGACRPPILMEHTARYVRFASAGVHELPALTEDDSIRLLRERLGPGVLTYARASEWARHAGGSPFLLLKMAQAHVDGADIDAPKAATAILELIVAPDVAKWSPQEGELLQLASCVGVEFDAQLLAEGLRLLDPDAPTGNLGVFRHLTALSRAHVVRAVGSCFAFESTLVQSAVYNGIADPLRVQMHSALADALLRSETARPEELTRHLLAAGRRDDADPFIDAAVESFQAAGLPREALRLLDQYVHDSSPTTSEGLRHAVTRLQLLVTVGRYEDAAEFAPREAEKAIRLGTAAIAAEIQRYQGEALRVLGHVPEAERAFQQSRQSAIESGDPSREMHAVLALGQLAMLQQDLGQAERYFQTILESPVQNGRADVHRKAQMNLACLPSRDRSLADRIALLEKAALALREAGDVRLEARAMVNIAGLRLSSGEMDAAMDDLERVLPLAREIGETDIEQLALDNLGALCGASGRLRTARDVLLDAFRLAQERGEHGARMYAVANLFELFSLVGTDADRREWRRRLEKELAQASGTAERAVLLVARSVGDARSAEWTPPQETQEALETHPDPSQPARIWLTHAHALERAGRRDQAQSVVTQVVELLHPVQENPLWPVACAHRAYLSREHVEDAERTWASSGPSSPLIERARGAYHLFLLTRKHGYLKEARDLVKRMLDGFTPDETTMILRANPEWRAILESADNVLEQVEDPP